MTTICTDGIRIASDTQVKSGDAICSGGAEKIIMNEHGVFALSGNLSLFRPLVDWYLAGFDPEKKPWKHVDDQYKGFAFWIFQNGEMYEVVDSSPYPCVCYAPDAIGSGREYALGVLDYGGTVEDAIRIAMARDASSGGQVVSLTLPDRLQLKPRIAA